MSNPKFPKKAREGKMIWKMDEEDRQQKISQVDKNWNQTKSRKKTPYLAQSKLSTKDGYHYHCYDEK